jgi:hypothetical protein
VAHGLALGVGGQRDGPATAALRVVAEDAMTALHLLSHVENPTLEVDVGPAESDDLAPVRRW